MFIYSFLTQFTVSVALPAHAHLHFVSLPRFVCVCVLQQQQQQHWLCAAADAHNQTILHSNFSPPHLEEVRLRRRRQCDDDFYTISYASIALVFHNALHALARCFLVFFFRPRFSSISIAQIYKQQKKNKRFKLISENCRNARAVYHKLQRICLRLFRVLSCLLSVLSHIYHSAALPHGAYKNNNYAQYLNLNALLFIFIRFDRNRTDNYIYDIFIYVKTFFFYLHAGRGHDAKVVGRQPCVCDGVQINLSQNSAHFSVYAVWPYTSCRTIPGCRDQAIDRGNGAACARLTRLVHLRPRPPEVSRHPLQYAASSSDAIVSDPRDRVVTPSAAEVEPVIR